jgi:soluble epoxide hydrolase / lipid-phosphate phosphatase
VIGSSSSFSTEAANVASAHHYSPTSMDNSLYKEIKVDRGFNYRYYFSPASTGKPVLLLLHGIPSTSHDWVRQIEYFQPKGYGIIAPDMLGFGRTSRPLDVNAFRQNLRAKDIIDILNKENIDKVVGIGHDWYVLALCIVLSFS